jgi:tetratricopeptide (TPR) repeat protein
MPGEPLLIFDNADSVEDLKPWIPSMPPQPGVSKHVIITTRRAGFTALGKVVKLDLMSPEEAVALMRTRLLLTDSGVLAQIADRLGLLPLALEQASAFLEQTGIPATEYLAGWNARPGLMHDRGRPSYHRDTIATLWQLSLDRIQNEDVAAVQLLDMCAHLAPEPIPLELFTKHPDLLPHPLSERAADWLAFSGTVGVLLEYSLIKRDSDTLQVHRLIQDVVRYRHTTHGAQAWPAAVSQSASSPAAWSAPMSAVIGVLRAEAPSPVLEAPENWPLWAILLPHVLIAATTNFRARNQTETVRAEGEELSWLLIHAGQFLYAQGRRSEALGLFKKALRICERVHGGNHAETAKALRWVAIASASLEGHATTAHLRERVVRINEAVLAQNDPEVATDLRQLAIAYWQLGRPSKALRLLRRAVGIHEAVDGPRSPTVARDRYFIGNALLGMGQYGEALNEFGCALGIHQEVYGLEHPDVANDQVGLGQTLSEMGRPSEAMPYLERASKIQRRILGSDHPDLARTLSYRGAALLQLGEPGKALSPLRRALRINERGYGERHQDVGVCLLRLAQALVELERVKEAFPLVERGLDIAAERYAPDYRLLFEWLRQLAGQLDEKGQRTIARDLRDKVNQISLGTEQHS